MKIYVIIGKNNILMSAGLVGASRTYEGAKKMQEENNWQLDESRIFETELEED